MDFNKDPAETVCLLDFLTTVLGSVKGFKMPRYVIKTKLVTDSPS